MKVDDFRSWVNKTYRGAVCIIDDGTGKASEEGRVYCRQITLMMKNNPKLYITKRFLLELRGGVWYIKNYDEAKRYVDCFVNCVLGDMLK